MTDPARKPLTSLASSSLQAREPLGVQVRLLTGDAVLVHITGGIDRNSAVELQHQLLQTISVGNSRPPHLLLDLSGVTYLDLAGLDALLSFSERVGAASGSVELLAPSPSVVRLLHETELDGQSHMTNGQDEKLD